RSASVGSRWAALVDRSRHTPELDNLDAVADLVWNRELAYAVLGRASGRMNVDLGIRDIDVVFFGHTPMPAPLRVDNTRWLDTGAGFGNRLSIAQLAVDGHVWSMTKADQTVAEGWTLSIRG